MTNTQHYQTLVARWRDLATTAAGIIPTVIPLEPTRGEVLAVREDLDVLIRKVDALVLAQAEYVSHMTGHKISRDYSTDQLCGAIDGQLFHEIEVAADEVRERAMEAVS